MEIQNEIIFWLESWKIDNESNLEEFEIDTSTTNKIFFSIKMKNNCELRGKIKINSGFSKNKLSKFEMAIKALSLAFDQTQSMGMHIELTI